MIFLKKGQLLATNTGLVVYDQTGYYEDGDTVVCALVTAPDEPVCRYEAKYIAYGDKVYAISKEEDLMQEIKKIDAKTLFGKNRAQAEAEKLMNEIIEREVPPPPPPKDVPPPELTPPTAATSTPTSTPATTIEPVATSTPSATTTPGQLIDTLEPTPLEVPTSTPPVMPTSTEPVIVPTEPPVIPLEAPVPPPPVLEIIPEAKESSEIIKGSVDQISSRARTRGAAQKIARVVRKKR